MGLLSSLRPLSWLLLAAILALGSYLRFETVDSTRIDHPFLTDSINYIAYAYNLKIYGIYSLDPALLRAEPGPPEPDAQRTPGYPLFLYAFTGTTDIDRFYGRVKSAQVIMSSLTILLTFMLTRVMIGQGAALLAAGLVAITPHLVMLNIYVVSETLFLFLCMAAFLPLTMGQRIGQGRAWFWFGTLLALAFMVRPSMQYYTLFFALFLWRAQGLEGRGRLLAASLLPILALFGVWWGRNLITLGFLSDPTVTVNTILHGIYPDFMYQGMEASYGFPYRYDPRAGEIGASLGGVLTTLWERASADPATYLRWYLSKPFHIFDWGIIQGQGDIFLYPVEDSPYGHKALFVRSRELMLALHPWLVYLAYLGALLVWLPRSILRLPAQGVVAARLVSLFYIYNMLAHIAVIPLPRYGIPLRPFTYILALVPLVAAVRPLVPGGWSGSTPRK